MQVLYRARHRGEGPVTHQAGVDFVRDNKHRMVILNASWPLDGVLFARYQYAQLQGCQFCETEHGFQDRKGGATMVGAGIQIRELYHQVNAQNHCR